MRNKFSKVIVAADHEQLLVGKNALKERLAGRQFAFEFAPRVKIGIDLTPQRLLHIAKCADNIYEFGLADNHDVQVAAGARKQTEVPIILFSYFNPLLQFGIEKLVDEAAAAGIDGILVTDLTPEEAGEFAGTLRAQELDMIFLVAPTSTSAPSTSAPLAPIKSNISTN